MANSNFKQWNLILGWVAFAVAFLTYALTVEPTVGFWDTGEYILTSSKLEVGHPPGAPLFQMLGAFFSIFASQPSQIGYVLNMMSAAASAFTILFMFWSIVLLLQKIIGQAKEFNTNKGAGILGAAFVGSLSFAFTDSFWFNAVETEVYAMATLIMAVMFYLGLRWEKEMHSPKGNRWLILISFIVGLSFGVHFMGLLTIPAIGLLYFFKNYKTITPKNFIVANVTVVAILLFVFKLLAPNILRYFSVLEIFFVNNIGLPFNSGSIIAFIILTLSIYFGLNYSKRKGYIVFNTGLLCVTFIIIGFTTWLMLPIRANANVPVNENNPSNARELLAYYNLEQYPKTHLFYGPQFTDQYAGLDENQPYTDDKPKYEKDEKSGRYVIVNDYENAIQNYNSDHGSLLPRMWSGEHAENYMIYSGPLEFSIKSEYKMQNEFRSLVANFRSSVAKGEIDYEGYHDFLRTYGRYLDIEKPSLIDNIYYLLDYQIGYMYWRYFMWNFSGRQDDIQGKMDMHGNWISGINFVDEYLLGITQDNLPSDVLNNKARNTYYLLPLLLGLIGLFFVYSKDKKVFWTMLVFFLFTGIAIQVYTNVRPFEPRERDYSLVGSFYVFALWIGIGVFALFDKAQTHFKSKLLAPVISLFCLVAVPGILLSQNWDDHDRSNRKTAHAMAVNYLESCAPNAIIFTIGDNDTFPLWYAQEIEGIRTDVRVVCTSLLSADWYIDQMKRKAYNSEPVPSKLTHDKYKWGTRDYIIKEVVTKDTLDIVQFLDFISSDDDRTKYGYVLEQQGYQTNGQRKQDLNANYAPTEFVRIPVNKQAVLRNGVVAAKDAEKIVDYIDIKIKDQAIYKNRMIMLDIIAQNNWERPIYFSGGAFGDEDYIWMKDYLQLDGFAYKLVPIKTALDKNNLYDMGRIDSEKMYELVKDWEWGNSGNPDVYHDVETRRNSLTFRGHMARLIEKLINEEQLEKAEEIADLAMQKMPVDIFGYYVYLEPFIGAYYETEADDKARALYKEVVVKYQESLNYFSGVSDENKEKHIQSIYFDIERYKSLVDTISIYEDEVFVKAEMEIFNGFLRLFTGEEDGQERPDE
ncbi:MAG: protein O-mannosyl-transferase family [Flavobacteriaceae bacterium]